MTILILHENPIENTRKHRPGNGRGYLFVPHLPGPGPLAVGGWKSNALRHPFISYRAVQIGLTRTALEAGNSESEAKRSYHDAMTEAQAAVWFAPFGTSSEMALVADPPKAVHIRWS